MNDQEKTRIDYVDNKALYEEYLVYNKALKEAEEAGLPRPELTKKISLAILQIANNLSRRYNFVNYSYREDMVGDAIIKCVAKAHLFDPEKTKNPFAYLTTICFWEMVNRIKKEHHEVSIKSKYIRENLTSEFLNAIEGEDGEFKNTFVEFLKDNDAYKDYTSDTKEKKTKKKKTDEISAIEELLKDEILKDE